MKKTNRNILLVIVLIIAVFAGAMILQNSRPGLTGTQELMLNAQDLQQLGLTSDINESDLQIFGLSNGTNCRTDNDYSNIIDSSSGQYSVCIYNIPSLNNTQIIIELTKFANFEALNGSYQYNSLHLYSIEGLISENTFGDQSRFRVNNVNDYGGEFNPPGIYFYHLWICKNLYLIHITSSGSKDAEGYIASIGQQILSKFG